MEYIEVSAKTVEDAISEAAIKLEVPSDKIEYEVITEGSTGFLGLIGSKPAVIKARKKFNLLDHTKDFLARLFKAMNVDVNSTVDYDEESRTMNIVFDGEDMGLLIGKRGQTLDSLQYLTNLAINKHSDEYYKVKIDTEDYRKRRKESPYPVRGDQGCLESFRRNNREQPARSDRIRPRCVSTRMQRESNAFSASPRRHVCKLYLHAW